MKKRDFPAIYNQSCLRVIYIGIQYAMSVDKEKDGSKNEGNCVPSDDNVI